MALVHIPTGNPYIGQPGQASYELVVVYIAGSALLAIIGTGNISLDAILFKTQPDPIAEIAAGMEPERAGPPPLQRTFFARGFGQSSSGFAIS